MLRAFVRPPLRQWHSLAFLTTEHLQESGFTPLRPIRDTPHILQCLVDSIAEGLSHAIYLVSQKYRRDILWHQGRYRTSSAHVRGREIAPNPSALRHPKPHIAGHRGVTASLR